MTGAIPGAPGAAGQGQAGQTEEQMLEEAIRRSMADQ
jgi:hypothetical protein